MKNLPYFRLYAINSVRNKKNGVIILCLILLSLNGYAQNNSNIELWTGLNYQLKLNKKFTANIAPEIRFTDTISRVSSTFFDLGLKYKINKSFDVKVNYRFSARPNKNNKDRLNLDLIYNWSKKEVPLSFSYRFRIQNSRTRNSGNSESYLRNKFSLDYNLSKLVDPYIAFELFFKFGKNEFRNTRYEFGLDWKLSKKLSLNTFYLYQREIFVGSPGSDHVFGLGLKYKAKIKKKESSKNSSIE